MLVMSSSLAFSSLASSKEIFSSGDGLFLALSDSLEMVSLSVLSSVSSLVFWVVNCSFLDLILRTSPSCRMRDFSSVIFPAPSCILIGSNFLVTISSIF